jgi:hypothetical protein
VSTRAFRDHALLVSTAQELGELREQVADLHLRVERLALLVEADTTLRGRTIDLEPEEWLGSVADVVERLRPYFEPSRSTS